MQVFLQVMLTFFGNILAQENIYGTSCPQENIYGEIYGATVNTLSVHNYPGAVTAVNLYGTSHC